MEREILRGEDRRERERLDTEAGEGGGRDKQGGGGDFNAQSIMTVLF